MAEVTTPAHRRALGCLGTSKDKEGHSRLFWDFYLDDSTESVPQALWDGSIISVLQWSKLRSRLLKFRVK